MTQTSHNSKYLTPIQIKIRDLIKRENINKQSVVADKLNISQGHVSRTFKLLGITKDEESGYFILPDEARIDESTKLLKDLTKTLQIKIVNYKTHFVLKTSSHRPRDISYAIKEMFPNKILGTVIDDNIIVIYPIDPNDCTDIFKKVKIVISS